MGPLVVLGIIGAGVLAVKLFHKGPAPAGIGAPAQPGNLMTTQGRSGRFWGVATNLTPMPVAPGTQVLDVWAIGTSPSGAVPLGGIPVLTYAQQGDINAGGTRQFVSSRRAATDPDLAAARADFGV